MTITEALKSKGLVIVPDNQTARYKSLLKNRVQALTQVGVLVEKQRNGDDSAECQAAIEHFLGRAQLWGNQMQALAG